MTEDTDTLARDTAPEDAVSAGNLLRSGREAAGLSVAGVAQQLKLAPRQVTALEDGDWANLPGRTFIRGFVRNYARLLRLDTDAVLAALPDAAAAPTHEHLSLAPTPRPMGELPADANAKPSPARWAIPLVMVAVVTVTALFEITRPPAEPARPAMIGNATAPSPTALPAASPAAATETPGNVTTALPNPLGAGDAQSVADANEAARKQETVDTPAGLAPMVATTDEPIALAFQGTSWVEIRDGTGALILSITGNAGSTQSVGGKPPFEVVVGNSTAVNVSWQGKAFDTAPFTRQNVARFTLK